MAVYIDDMYTIPMGEFQGMKMSHMIADSTVELFSMCDKIGVQKKWIQNAGDKREHFDICLSKRSKAIKAGAIEIGLRDLAKITNGRKILYITPLNAIFTPGEEIIGSISPVKIEQKALF